MRHGKVGRKLKRTASHRKATLSALSVALLQHKRIKTTVAKAKETKNVVERLITKAKNAVAAETEEAKNVHARRHVFSILRDREAVTTLFNEVAPKVATRPGGYTRIIKLGQRRGDAAEMAVIELVDFNVADEKPAKTAKKPAAKKTKKTAEKDAAAPNAEVSAETTGADEEKKPAAKAKTKGKKAGGKDSSSAKA